MIIDKHSFVLRYGKFCGGTYFMLSVEATKEENGILVPMARKRKGAIGRGVSAAQSNN